MSLFKNMLREDESLFTNSVALDYDFLPKKIPYRESEQDFIAACINPLFQKRNGKNILMYGKPGIGKTAAVKHVLKDLEENSGDDIFQIYINCWQKNTTYKIIIEMCDQIGYKLTHNKNSEDLFKILEKYLNKGSLVIAFDEIDKVEDLDFLYTILENIYRKSIILITNYKDWVTKMDERVRSRLTLQLLEFKEYSHDETRGILFERKRSAFISDVWEEDAFELIVNKSAKLKDIRTGLYLLKQAGDLAEAGAKRKIAIDQVMKAINSLDEFTIKNSMTLDKEENDLLALIKENSGKRIGELFNVYKEKGGMGVYKTFQRKIEKLSKNGFVNVNKITGGAQGTTTIVNYKSKEKKLTEF
jgi:archaeal cell division control protein 6